MRKRCHNGLRHSAAFGKSRKSSRFFKFFPNHQLFESFRCTQKLGNWCLDIIRCQKGEAQDSSFWNTRLPLMGVPSSLFGKLEIVGDQPIAVVLISR